MNTLDDTLEQLEASKTTIMSYLSQIDEDPSFAEKFWPLIDVELLAFHGYYISVMRELGELSSVHAGYVRTDRIEEKFRESPRDVCILSNSLGYVSGALTTAVRLYQIEKAELN